MHVYHNPLCITSRISEFINLIQSNYRRKLTQMVLIELRINLIMITFSADGKSHIVPHHWTSLDNTDNFKEIGKFVITFCI